AEVDPRRSTAGDLDDPDLYVGVSGPRLGIAHRHERRVEGVLIQQVERGDGGLVQSPERDAFAIGTPTERVAQVELFLIYPVGRAVDDVLAAVPRERGLSTGREVGHVDVVVANECHLTPVG